MFNVSRLFVDKTNLTEVFERQYRTREIFKIMGIKKRNVKFSMAETNFDGDI